MGVSDSGWVGGSRENVTLQAMKQVAQDEMEELHAERMTSKEAFLQSLETLSNPFARRQSERKKEIEKRRQSVIDAQGLEDKGQEGSATQQFKSAAEKFAARNPELRAPTLLLLRQRIRPDDKAEDILKKLLEMYSDVSLADEALEYLAETTEGDLAKEVADAKDQINERFGREIVAGRNIHEQARSAASAGLGTPTSMRDMYRDITGNPRDSHQLFQELSQKYAFKELKTVADFLLHSLGQDMKSKGPSIPRGELHRLLTETRSLQAILGVYRFFKGRMGLVHSLFQKGGLNVPKELSFEEIARQFMLLAGERYPSSGKVMDRAVRLGIEDWILAKIIVFSQMRDAVREVAMKQIYRSLQHRDDLYLALIEALEDLEDQLEELAEKEEEEGEGEGGEEEESEE